MLGKPDKFLGCDPAIVEVQEHGAPRPVHEQRRLSVRDDLDQLVGRGVGLGDGVDVEEVLDFPFLPGAEVQESLDDVVRATLDGGDMLPDLNLVDVVPTG